MAANDLVDVAGRLLAAHVDASVVAIDENGRFIPMPSAVPLTSHRTIEGHASALEIVIQSDIVAVIEAWKRVLVHGIDVVEVHPLGAPDTTMTLTFVDVRTKYGVILGIALHPEGTLISPFRGAHNLLRPRVSVVRKTRVAEFTDIDDAFEVLLGYSRSTLIGRRNLDFVHPEDHGRALANWIDMLGTPGASRRVRLRLQHHDGHWIWFETTNHNRVDDPAEQCVVAEMIDISDEMTAHENLRVSQELLLRLTETLPVGVLQVDAAGLIVYQNERASQMLGRETAGTLEELLSAVVDGDRDLLLDSTHAVLHRGENVDLEISVGHPNGELVRCRIGLRALLNEDAASTGAIAFIDDVTEGARLREQLEIRATYDALTGCHNRASILAGLDRALVEANAQQTGVAVVFIDLDGFKAVNDALGHIQGDALLERIGRQLRDGSRRNDIVGRVGGDEFLVVGRGGKSAEEALAMGERIARTLADTHLLRRTVASVGVTWTSAFPSPTDMSADLLVASADSAMYESKREGLGRPIMNAAG